MIEGVSLRNPLFVNTVGHACGVLLFGLLIVLLLSGRGRREGMERRASLIAASLAFMWNLGSLLGLASTHQNGEIPDWLVALNFSVLSFLPAVLLKVVLKQRYIWLARLGYLLGVVSATLHFGELRWSSAGLHEAALLTTTVGFVLLLACFVACSVVKSDWRTSLADVLCLLLFTLSFLHFGYGHVNIAWSSEVAWHHAGLPLILIVLLRDYRLLLLETVVRFVANLGVAVFFALGLYWINKSAHLLERARGNGFAVGVLLISFCFSLVLFAYLRSLLQRQLTRRVFRRGDLNVCVNRILQVASEAKSEQELLNGAVAEMGRFVEAERVDIVPKGTSPEGGHSWAETELELRFSRGDVLRVLLGLRRGSSRYLAEDIAALTQLSTLLTEQVERFRTNELQRLAREAELLALQAQINPHFLFNALNTLYGTIGRESFQARRLVLNLADLFRYCLQRERAFIPLREELAIVQAYLEIEALRLGDRLSTEITATDAAQSVVIPILTVQPLVENAVKHGISRRSANGQVRVVASESDGVLQVVVHDNGPGFPAPTIKSGLGLGLNNVRQRLRLCYGALADLKIESGPEWTSVTLVVPVCRDESGRLTSLAPPVSDSISPVVQAG